MRRQVVCLSMMIVAVFACPLPAEAETLHFADACRPGKRIVVAAVGDLLFHKKLQLQAYRKGSSFRRFWEPVATVLSSADMTYGNLEGAVARGVSRTGRAVADPGRRLDGNVYGADLKTLSFNYHPSVVGDLKAGGFDVLSTANNHAMDRGALGVDRTIRSLREHKMPFSGTRHRGESGEPWSATVRAKGFRIAWLACSNSTNGIADRHGQVLRCFKQKQELLAHVTALDGNPAIDGVIVTPHWGTENHHRPNARQRQFARDAIDAGALSVIGAHPHVLQSWEKHVTADGRQGLVIYSAGNFISNQRQLAERAGIIAVVELAKNDKGKAVLSAAGYVPTWVQIDGKGHRVVANRSKRGWPGKAYAYTLGLLPAGNVLSADWPPAFAKPCEGAKTSRGAGVPGVKPDRHWVRNPVSPKTVAKRRADAVVSKWFGNGKRRKRARDGR